MDVVVVVVVVMVVVMVVVVVVVVVIVVVVVVAVVVVVVVAVVVAAAVVVLKARLSYAALAAESRTCSGLTNLSTAQLRPTVTAAEFLVMRNSDWSQRKRSRVLLGGA